MILFIDELHTVVGAGKAEGAADAANLLKPALARGELRCIGATTLDEYRKHIEKDAALERRFQPVYVGEPSVEDTIAILRGLKPRYEAHHGVKIKDSALVAAAKLSHRYITDRFLPDKAIDLVDEAASRLAMELESVPTEIDEVQRRLMQLELAARQLAEETEESTQERLAEIEAEMAELKRKLASLREQWEAEKLGVGDVQKLRKELDQRRARILSSSKRRSRRSSRAGIPPSEDDYQKLLRARQQAAAACKSGSKPPTSDEERRSPTRTAAAAPGSDRGRNRRGRQRLDRHSGQPMLETEQAKLLVHGRAAAPARRRPGRGGRRRGECRPPQPQRPAGPAIGRSARSCSSGPPASARPSCARRWPKSCSTTRTRWSAST